VTQVYLYCSNANEVLVDRCGAVVDDLAEARGLAARVVRSLTKARAASKIGAAGSCTSTTTSVMNPSLSPSLSCSARRVEVAMLAVQSPMAPLRRCVVGIKMRCSKLIVNACDPYRPERHYMRGPGPKWFVRHGAYQSSDPSKRGKLRLSERQTQQSLLSAGIECADLSAKLE
jgi:hypothetical protein